MSLVGDRLAFVPRYRQRLATVPGRLARPVWVDDDDFDLTYHVRQSAVPRPGSMEQVHELVARIITRPLDRTRPLWEMYLIEGLADGRVAILSKSHQTLVDGVSTIDLGQVILDNDTVVRERVPDEWTPRSEPSAAVDARPWRPTSGCGTRARPSPVSARAPSPWPTPSRRP